MFREAKELTTISVGDIGVVPVWGQGRRELVSALDE